MVFALLVAVHTDCPDKIDPHLDAIDEVNGKSIAAIHPKPLTFETDRKHISIETLYPAQ